jgi:hypothetical protein
LVWLSSHFSGGGTRVSRLGLEALRFWLRTGGKLQALDWD